MGLKRLKRKIEGKIKYDNDLKKYIHQCDNNYQFTYNSNDKWPILGEWDNEAGDVDNHYFFQDIYVAQQVHNVGVKHIYDIGSRVDGYISHLLSMGIEVTMMDVRPLKRKIKGLHFVQADATNLDTVEDSSLNAISSLHAIEHFGLGRYGDPIDYWGWKKALNAMKKKLTVGGYLFVSVPVGKEEKVMFNAHRIFSPLTIVKELQDNMKVMRFALIHDGEISEVNFSENEDVLTQLSKDVLHRLGEYDCGVFVFRKK